VSVPPGSPESVSAATLAQAKLEGGRRARKPGQDVAGVDRGGGRGARIGRVKRDLMPVAVDGGALVAAHTVAHDPNNDENPVNTGVLKYRYRDSKPQTIVAIRGHPGFTGV
jgi:hypothetical protein